MSDLNSTVHAIPMHSFLGGFYGSTTGIVIATIAFLVIFLQSTKPWLRDASQPTKDGEPPLAKFWIPVLGPIMALLMGQEKMWHTFQNFKPKDREPAYTLRIFGQTMYFVSDLASISAVWRKPKVFQFWPFQVRILRSVFGATPTLLSHFELDKEENHKNAETIHTLFHKWMTLPSSLNTLINRYTVELQKLFSEKYDDQEWQEIHLFKFVRDTVARTNARTIFGYRLNLSDSDWDDFWTFDRALIDLAKEMPEIFNRSAIQARTRIIRAFLEWGKEVTPLLDTVDSEAEWTELYGSKINRERIIFFEGLNRKAEDRWGVAASQMGWFWGVEANATPATGWAMTYLLFIPGLLERVREEVKSCIISTSKPTRLPDFDIEGLLQLPLMKAFLNETLRLSSTSLSIRIVEEDTELNGYKIKKGGLIQALFGINQQDERHWGSDVMKFNLDRFLDKSSASRQKYLVPFGGGTSYCPGRLFATREILYTVALLATAYDWDIGTSKMPEYDRKHWGLGVLPELKDSKVRMRKKSDRVW